MEESKICHLGKGLILVVFNPDLTVYTLFSMKEEASLLHIVFTMRSVYCLKYHYHVCNKHAVFIGNKMLIRAIV